MMDFRLFGQVMILCLVGGYQCCGGTCPSVSYPIIPVTTYYGTAQCHNPEDYSLNFIIYHIFFHESTEKHLIFNNYIVFKTRRCQWRVSKLYVLTYQLLLPDSFFSYSSCGALKITML
jgi:hypothetical protein